jgi:nucleoside-diphosphate-sugar epimerase
VETNVMGTLNVVQAARECEVQKVVHTSTSETYGTATYVPIDENHPLQSQSPYSASKTGADQMAYSYYCSFGVPVCILRPFNTYGPRQSARAIIPTLITQIAAGKKEILLGNLAPTRDFNFVRDTVRGLILLATCDKAIGEVVNIGSNSEISIDDLALKIKKIMNSNAEIRTEDIRKRPEDSEVQRLWCDNTKIKGLVNYCPRYSLEQGLETTVRWFEKNAALAKYKMNIYNV